MINELILDGMIREGFGMEPIQHIVVNNEEEHKTEKIFPGTIRKGVFIEDDRLEKAGILQDVLVRMEDGKILITSSIREFLEEEPSDAGWKLWEQVGSKPTSGIFEDASVNHDKYLYEGPCED